MKMNRRAQLESLAQNLSRLVEMLRLDPQCQWRGHFEQCLLATQKHLESDFTQDDLNALSSSVTHVYGGMGSFADYAPGSFDSQSGRYLVIAGMEAFDEIADQVCEAALSLRVVGTAA